MFPSVHGQMSARQTDTAPHPDQRRLAACPQSTANVNFRSDPPPDAMAVGVSGAAPALCQYATRRPGTLRFGTRVERTAPESLLARCFPLFTARCRRNGTTPHHIQTNTDPPLARSRRQTLIADPDPTADAPHGEAGPRHPCLCQNATRRRSVLRFGTRKERTTSESLLA